MPINEFFAPYDQVEEQDLLLDLNTECIEVLGHKMYYLPRTQPNLDTIFGESTSSTFTNAYEIEAYVGAEGEGIPAFITHSGGVPEIRQTHKFTISKKTFTDRLYGANIARPREGDMIYFGMDDEMMFEVRYVDDEIPFHQLGGGYVWVCKVEAMEYSNEKIRTGIPEIDSIENRYVSACDITLDSVSGDFEDNEIVYQGTNLAGYVFKAEVLSWDSDTKLLRVKHLLGAFDEDEDIIGNTSDAEGVIASSTIADGSNSSNEDMSDNKKLQEE